MSRAPDNLGAMDGRRVLVVGDVMLDRFVRGVVSRVSPEAPVPVVSVENRSDHPGGAANVALNVAGFTGAVDLVGVVGSDEAADRLAELLQEEGIACHALVRSRTRVTSTKTRVVARHQQVVRFDEEDTAPLTPDEEAEVLAALQGAEERYDCVILEDYAKGMFTPAVIERLREVARSGVATAVDPNPRHLVDWSGFTAVKPNLHEACAATGRRVDLRHEEGAAELGAVAAELMERWAPRHLLVTLGEAGMLYTASGADAPVRIPALAREVFDVSGAGDTAIAVFALALASGWPGVDAAQLANTASSLAVAKAGTATVARKELEEALAHGSGREPASPPMPRTQT